MRWKDSSAIMFVVLLLLASVVSAHEDDMDESEEGMGHQFEEISPFTHFGEGHAFAGIVLIILWISFFYAVYNLVIKHSKKK